MRAWLRSQALPCALCGQPIDYSLPAGHPLSFEVDEIVPVSRGGSPFERANVQPAHRICNERKGARMQHEIEVTDKAIDERGEVVSVARLTMGVPPIPTTDW